MLPEALAVALLTALLCFTTGITNWKHLSPPSYPAIVHSDTGLSSLRYPQHHVMAITPRCEASSAELRHSPPKRPSAQHALNHVDCAACEAARKEAMQESDLGALLFSEAAKLWLESHSPYIAERTIHDYRQYIGALNQWFGGMVVHDINIGNIREYHAWRLQAAGACRVRMESSTLRQIMTEANCWQKIKPLYKHPPLSRHEKDGAGQSFTPDQEMAFVQIALSMPRCELVGHCAQIMFHTGFGFGELRHARRRDLSIESGTLTVVLGTKNEERERTVPLTASAFRSATWLLERWEDLGGEDWDQYLLPYRGPNFSRPMVSIQNGWNAVINECVKRNVFPHGFRPS